MPQDFGRLALDKVFYQYFSNLNAIQCGAFADIVGNYPEIQATRVRYVFTDSPDINRILAGRFGHSSRIASRQPFVDYHDARRPAQ